MIDEDFRNQTRISGYLGNDISFGYFGDALQAESTIIILFIAREIVELERQSEIELGIQHLRVLARHSCDVLGSSGPDLILEDPQLRKSFLPNSGLMRAAFLYLSTFLRETQY